MAGQAEGVVTSLLGVVCLLLLTATHWTPAGGQDPQDVSSDLLILACMSFFWSIVYIFGVFWERTSKHEWLPVIKYHQWDTPNSAPDGMTVVSMECLLEDIKGQKCVIHLIPQYRTDSTFMCSSLLCHLLLILLHLARLEKALRLLDLSSTVTTGLTLTPPHLLHVLVRILPVLVVFINVSLGVVHLLRFILTLPHRTRQSLFKDMEI